MGKTERSVRNWITKLAEKSSVIAEKSSVSSPTHPADFDLEETCLIIETGLGKNAADLFRMSANTTPTTAPATYDGKDKINFYLTQAVLELQKRDDEREQQIKSIVKVYGNRIAEITKKQKMIESPDTKHQIELARRINGFTQSELDRYLDELNGPHSYLYK